MELRVKWDRTSSRYNTYADWFDIQQTESDPVHGVISVFFLDIDIRHYKKEYLINPFFSDKIPAEELEIAVIIIQHDVKLTSKHCLVFHFDHFDEAVEFAKEAFEFLCEQDWGFILSNPNTVQV